MDYTELYKILDDNNISYEVDEPQRDIAIKIILELCLLYTSPSPRDRTRSRMPSSA